MTQESKCHCIMDQELPLPAVSSHVLDLHAELFKDRMISTRLCWETLVAVSRAKQDREPTTLASGGHVALTHRKRRLADEPRYAMLLKKTSNSWSLSKSAAMTVRTGDGMDSLGVAMSWGKDGD